MLRRFYDNCNLTCTRAPYLLQIMWLKISHQWDNKMSWILNHNAGTRTAFSLLSRGRFRVPTGIIIVTQLYSPTALCSHNCWNNTRRAVGTHALPPPPPPPPIPHPHPAYPSLFWLTVTASVSSPSDETKKTRSWVLQAWARYRPHGNGKKPRCTGNIM